jgi:NAD(P)-dependent dehydrogenase (short-subunit alcohol dehydrogenase family)
MPSCSDLIYRIAARIYPISTMSKIILVTGGNGGIGLELVRLLAKGNVVYMASRNESAGKEAQCVLVG